MDKMKFDIGVLIPLKEEFRYVVEFTHQIDSILHEGTHFYRLDFGPITAVCCLIDQMGPLAALHATTRLLDFADIKLLVLLGTAGALDDDVAIGDVVIAAEVNEFQANAKAEATDDGYEVRYSGRHWPLEFRIREAITHFEFSSRNAFETWQSTASSDYKDIALEGKESVCTPPPSLHLGAIASGNIVAASKAFAAEIKRINRKFLAIDMEAAGIANAASDRIHPIPYLVVRGISDKADENKKGLDKGSKNAWRRYGVRNAVSLLRNLLTWKDFVDAASLTTSSTTQTESDTACELATLLKSFTGGPWAVGVLFGIYSHGPRVGDNGIVVPVDLNRLRLTNTPTTEFMDSLDRIKFDLKVYNSLLPAANAIEKLVEDFRCRLGSADANALLQEFDKVVMEILSPKADNEKVDSLLLQADRLEEDVGPEAAVELLKDVAKDHRWLRERYVDALANANMWAALAQFVAQCEFADLSRRELEHGIFAFAKFGPKEHAETIMLLHQKSYGDKAALLFREQMNRHVEILQKAPDVKS